MSKKLQQGTLASLDAMVILYHLQHLITSISLSLRNPWNQMIFSLFHSHKSTVHLLLKLLSCFVKHQNSLILLGKLLIYQRLISITSTCTFWLWSYLLFKILLHYFFSLKKLLKTKADAFLSNDYYESDLAWMELVSVLTIWLSILWGICNN